VCPLCYLSQIGIAAQCAAARVIGRPTVVIISDTVGNVEATAKKFRTFLRDNELAMGVSYLGESSGEWNKFEGDDDAVRAFIEGREVLVLPFYEKALAHFNALVHKHNVVGYVVNLDECDRMFSTRPDAAGRLPRGVTARERELYSVLDMGSGTPV
jgi:hypothetical protein